MKKHLLLLLLLFTFLAKAQNSVKPTAITQIAGTSESALGLSLEDLITGSGLSSEPTTVADFATTTHANAWADSWATGNEGSPSYFADTADYPDVVFEINLGVAYNLTSFAYWGYPVLPANNPKTVVLQFSTDGGVTYTATENITLGSSVGSGDPIAIPHQSASWATPRKANFVKLTITDNHGGSRVGFAELRFGGDVAVAVPNDPSNLVATATSDSEITVSWDDNSDNETGFKLERKEGTGAYSEIATPAAGVTSYSDSGLNPSTIYSYRVKATNGDGDSIGSAEGGGATKASNGRPTILITPTSITQEAGNSEGCCGLSVGDMIDDSGLSVTPTVTNINTVTHSGNFGEGNAFATATDQAGGYFSASNPDPVFTLSLGNNYNVSSLVIWGYPLDPSAEAKSFKVEFSTDGGTTYAEGVENVTNSSSLGGNSNAAILTFSSVKTANFVRITFTDNHGGGRAALGEVKFVGALNEPLSLDSNSLSRIKVYPNPSSDYLFVSNIEDEGEAIIYNVFGKKIKSFKLSIGMEKINIKDLSTGIYMVSLNNAGKSLMKKIIKK
ncbi:discoidin domain-containing protein [Polaribacter batillariae]|uniref:Discoidin domain-containing protein n=1 Tax=Polaribacter batillariae TaxID=2808900 RepID=A0ABX7SXU9_9FLAO|nr:discoidin domain-containing protein [Polaribacter batillariae]QTD37649.1 discoidin domain-containing protein [Polaribacter batillariae]